MRAAALLLVLAGCGWPTPYQQQRSYAATLKPAEVAPKATTPARPLRVLRVRAYADGDYQAQTPRWNEQVAEQLSRASAVLEAQFGVQLLLESARPWSRPGSSAHLETVLEQLVAHDKGEGVAWVLGFVSSQAVFSAAQDQLGAAVLFGHHLVLRGMFSAAEMDAIDSSLNLLSTQDRETLGRERRLHKETAVLLHEWAHTLGAIHDRAPDTLMAPTYDKSQARFSDTSARLAGLGLDFRDAPQSRETWASKYKEELARPGASFYDAGERERALLSAGQLTSDAWAKPPPAPLPPEDAKRLKEVVRLEDLGEVKRALQLLLPLIDRYPRSLQVQSRACALLQQTVATPNSLLAGCARAAALPEAPPEALLLVAQLQLKAGFPSEAAGLLSRAEARLPAEPALWLTLAQLQLATGALSAAERALQHAPHERGAELVAAECARTRRYVGFPREPLEPGQEPAYLAAALAGHDQIDRRDLAEALRRSAQLARDFPGTPAAAVLECRARSRSKDLAAIQLACAAAVDGAPDAFLPRYILGLVASARAHWSDAQTQLQRSLELDGSGREVWASLAAVEEHLRAAPALRALQSSYRAKFGTRLVPALFPAGWAAR